MIDIAKILIQNEADPFAVFDDPQAIVDFFKKDIEWMPEERKKKIRRMIKGRNAFGM